MLPAMAPLRAPLRSLREGTAEAQGSHEALHKGDTGENDEVKLGSGLCVYVFFSTANLGSGRSQGGQGLAQGDTAENGSLLHPVLPRDSMLSKMT